VDGATARSLAADGARVVDVRTPQEFAEGHVPGALNVPHDEIARRAEEIGPPSTKVVVYCRSGRRSAVAAQALEKLGYRQVYDLGSFSAWPRDAAGEPVKP
jgi:rhodanese-related sulfurtransferase